MTDSSRLRTAPLHALLFPAVPVLSLYAVNPGTSPGDVLLALALLGGAAGLIFLGGWLVLRDTSRAGLMATVLLALAFLYGPAVALGADRVRERYVFVALVGLMALVAVLLARTRRPRPLLTQYLNVTAACLVALGIAHGAWAWNRTRPPEPNPAVAAPSVAPGAGATARPSVLYLVLDEYARADTLEALYGHDNGGFIRALEARGFCVLDRSCANYPSTFLSLGASLTMRYLDEEARAVGPDSRNRIPVYAATRDNAVVQTLRRHGYRYVNVSSGLGLTNHIPAADRNVVYGRLPPFVGSLAVASVARPLLPLVANRHEAILDTFQGIPGLLADNPPVFVMAHVVIPHRPYLFTRTGERLQAPMTESYFGSAQTEPEPYLDQLLYVNTLVLALLDAIHDRLGDNVAIVIQSDHGPDLLNAWHAPSPAFVRERLAILNAIRLPGGRRVDLPDTATPVNTFRAVLDAVLGTSHDRLPDRSFFSTYERPYDWREVTPCDAGAWTDRRPY